MRTAKDGFQSIDAYISTCPESVQSILAELRAVIRAAAPEAVETISYQMPAFAQNGVLVYFAACKGHIGFYPTSGPIEAFKHELMAYECSKGAIRFPLDEPLPWDLVSRIVKHRVEENANKPLRVAATRK